MHIAGRKGLQLKRARSTEISQLMMLSRWINFRAAGRWALCELGVKQKVAQETVDFVDDFFELRAMSSICCLEQILPTGTADFEIDS